MCDNPAVMLLDDDIEEVGDSKPPPMKKSRQRDVITLDSDDDEISNSKKKHKKAETPTSMVGLTEDCDVQFVTSIVVPTPCKRTLRQIRRQQRQDEELARSLQKIEDDDYVAVAPEPTYDVLQEHRRNVESMVKVRATGFKVVSIVENPHAKVGTKLYNRFVEAWQLVQDQSVELAFHGTAESNIEAICEQGLDPSKRLSQAMGPGEYFAKNAGVSLPYCKGGKKLLVVALLVDKTGLTTKQYDIFVIHKPEHQLPLFVVTFQ